MFLRKITEIVATKCHILRLKCTKFDFRWGSAPHPAGGAYSAPPDPLAGFKGPTSKGGEGEEGREGWKGEERGGERRVKGGEGKVSPSLPYVTNTTLILNKQEMDTRQSWHL